MLEMFCLVLVNIFFLIVFIWFLFDVGNEWWVFNNNKESLNIKILKYFLSKIIMSKFVYVKLGVLLNEN